MNKNIVRYTEEKWNALFAWKDYVVWEYIESNSYYFSKYNEEDSLTADEKSKLFYINWRYVWVYENARYINHSKTPNAMVYQEKETWPLLIVATEPIKKWTEITINYWEENINFIINEKSLEIDI